MSVSLNVKYIWRRLRSRHLDEFFVRADQLTIGFPFGCSRPGQVKTLNFVLLNCFDFRVADMKFPVLAEYDPAFWADYAHPLVIRHVMSKAFFLMPFHVEWRLEVQQCFWQSLSDISVKIKGQFGQCIVVSSR